MNDQEQALATNIYTAIMEGMHRTDRSAQAADFRVGVSDLGFCSERLRRFLDRQKPEEIDMLPAFIGTWLGEGIEHSIPLAFPDAIIQSEVEITLQGEQGEYIIPGHPDVILPGEGIVLDGKSAFGLENARRSGFDDLSKKFQRQLYGLAAFEAGFFGDRPIEEIQVGNLWIDRSGTERELLVRLEPLDPEVRIDATQWLDDVVYHWQHGEEAQKQPPREMCAKACGFFSVCRAYDTDVTGLLTDPEILTAVDLYKEGGAMEREGKKLKEQAKGVLAGVEGSTREFSVRWVHVNESNVQFVRAPYDKLQITKVK